MLRKTRPSDDRMEDAIAASMRPQRNAAENEFWDLVEARALPLQ